MREMIEMIDSLPTSHENKAAIKAGNGRRLLFASPS
jgi:hypothetical protein